ncbi:High-affinity nickel transport protein [Ralstonia psammae]|uniref:Nickel/cobalt efflux system n=2 Tax=Ralstonia psammae TaxID=3058598 RepID=A0ABM9JYX6_9RALS|nr:High-affinity nickel transport protein [Ralstonia sp. LMG 19083]
MHFAKGLLMASPLAHRPAAPRRTPVSLLLALIAINVLVWAWAIVAFAGQPALLGTALLAYLFGLRHAVDADHIAAIDNVVRKLVQQGQRPFSVGFFFSTGHSTLIALAVFVLVASSSAMESRLGVFKEAGAGFSTAISALFLLAIAMTNLFILSGVWKQFVRIRNGEPVCAEDMDMLMAGNGVLARLFRPMFRLVTKSWHMFPLGFLFGLGFDTATEIGLFSLSAAQPHQGVPFLSVMVFPALFTAGMALVDTVDSILMVGAYGWAFINPMRKIWYNFTITLTSALMALVIGTIEALGLLASRLNLTEGPWVWVFRLNERLAEFGYVAIGLLVLSWAVSAGIYKWKGYDSLPASTLEGSPQ